MVQPFDYRSFDFPIVCLCGSAGALNAYRTILARLTGGPGVAIVVLAHRAPENSTLLPLLANVTDMPVSEVEEGTILEPDHVFLMPPRVYMTTTGKSFHLQPNRRYGWPKSISVFLFSLASSIGSRAIVVILSGMAADGSDALGLIKAAGGWTFAQSGAVYDSMPQNAIDTGHVDYIFPAVGISEQIARMI